jgi:Uma2 family endonuclease
METLLEQITKTPQMPRILEDLQHFWMEEQTNRKNFQENAETVKAEFINGKIIKKMSNRLEHNEVQGFLFQILNPYVMLNNLGKVGIDQLLVSLTRNDYEPDICFWGNEKAQRFTKSQLLFPAPDFAVEILSKSTEKTDRGIKFEDYAAHDVYEYWLIDPKKQFIEQYQLYQGSYEILGKIDISGKIKSISVKGFEIPVKALFDEQENLKTLAKFFI